jgi:aquaporin Z
VRKYVTEFLGTFVFVFTVCSAVLSKTPFGALGIGLILAALVFAGGHISGGHYNPAVSLAVFLRGKLGQADVLPYMAAQLVGGALAALAARLAFTVHPVAMHASGRQLTGALIAEFVFTFALCFTVLNVATSKDHPNNSFYGLAIGLVVAAGGIAVGSLSGGVFNPAIAFGLCLAGLVSWSLIWVYLVATLVAAVVAAFLFRYLNPSDVAPMPRMPRATKAAR